MLDIQAATRGLTDEDIRNRVRQMTEPFFRRANRMAQYTGKQSVLDEALGEFKDYGFSLVEPDDHLLELRLDGETVAVFNQTRATADSIRESCRRHLATRRGRG